VALYAECTEGGFSGAACTASQGARADNRLGRACDQAAELCRQVLINSTGISLSTYKHCWALLSTDETPGSPPSQRRRRGCRSALSASVIESTEQCRQTLLTCCGSIATGGTQDRIATQTGKRRRHLTSEASVAKLQKYAAKRLEGEALRNAALINTNEMHI